MLSSYGKKNNFRRTSYSRSHILNIGTVFEFWCWDFNRMNFVLFN